ncbi:hypothetical protein EDB19DRAFT_615498 [Suillus lakei]|nr:hypothetical protein EDB19DRAFT_615498 [Suillus lakei]
MEIKINLDTLRRAEADQLLRALSQCKACQTLEYVDIFAGDPAVEERSGNSFAPMRQFLCFRQLRTLQLVFPHCCSNLDNDLLFEAMSSWPHIRSLELMDPHLCSPAVPFRGFFAALRLCPHLQILRMYVDATHIDIDPTAELFQHTSLQTLDLDSHKVADAETVARIILSMLPCVDQVNQVYAGGDCREEWQEVNRHLKSFKPSPVLGRQIIRAAPQS